MEIGQQIIRYRKQQALSQEELAEKVYVSRRAYLTGKMTKLTQTSIASYS